MSWEHTGCRPQLADPFVRAFIYKYVKPHYVLADLMARRSKGELQDTCFPFCRNCLFFARAKISM